MRRSDVAGIAILRALRKRFLRGARQPVQCSKAVTRSWNSRKPVCLTQDFVHPGTMQAADHAVSRRPQRRGAYVLQHIDNAGPQKTVDHR